MDQEISRITWTGVSLLFLVGAIGMAIVIFGFGRTVAVTELNSLSKKLTDDNIRELAELEDATVDLTSSAIISILDRNKRLIKNTVITFKTGSGTGSVSVNGDNNASNNVRRYLKAYGPGMINYTTQFKQNVDGTTTITVYAY